MRIMGAFFCFVMCFMPGSGTSYDPDTLFRELAPTERDILAHRLDKMIAYQSHANWGSVYDLLSIFDRNGMTKAQYIKYRLEISDDVHPTLMEFYPQHCTKLMDDHYVINGCGKYRQFGEIKMYGSELTVVKERAGFYFSETGIMVQAESDHRRDCSPFEECSDNQ